MIRLTLRRLAAAALLLGIAAGPAFAAGQAVTLYDQHDNALGTTANPLVVSGGSGGGSGGAITGPLGPSTTAANSVATTFGSGTTLPAFTAPPSVLVGVYNASLPTLTTGSAAQAALDVNGKLLVQGGNSAALKTDGSATTQPVSAAALPLPTGAATAGNQASEISAVSGRNNYIATSSTSFAANSFLNDGNYLSLGASPSPYLWVLATFFSNQAGTYYIQAVDSNGSYTMQTAALSASNLVTVRLPVAITGGTSMRYRAYIVNGSTAATLASASVALTTN